MSDVALPGAVSETALDLPDDLPKDKTAECGRVLLGMHQSSCWWLGDWFNYIQERFPDEWPQMVEANEYEERTLRKWGWVCRKIPRGTRSSRLSPRHHELIAHLPVAEQTRYIKEAEPEGESSTPRMSTRELDARIKEDREPSEAQNGHKNVEMIDMCACPECGSAFKTRSAQFWTEEA